MSGDDQIVSTKKKQLMKARDSMYSKAGASAINRSTIIHELQPALKDERAWPRFIFPGVLALCLLACASEPVSGNYGAYGTADSSKPFHRSFVLTREADGRPIGKQRYRVTFGNGKVIEGIADENGATPVMYFDREEPLKIQWFRNPGK